MSLICGLEMLLIRQSCAIASLRWCGNNLCLFTRSGSLLRPLLVRVRLASIASPAEAWTITAATRDPTSTSSEVSFWYRVEHVLVLLLLNSYDVACMSLLFVLALVVSHCNVRRVARPTRSIALLVCWFLPKDLAELTAYGGRHIAHRLAGYHSGNGLIASAFSEHQNSKVLPSGVARLRERVRDVELNAPHRSQWPHPACAALTSIPRCSPGEFRSFE